MGITDRRQLLNDAEASLRIALNGRQATIWTALPCVVKSVDWSAMTIEAQPTIQGEKDLEDGTVEYVNLPLLGDVPICFPSAGGFTFTFPVQVGDEVLVVFASRCIDSWFQQGGIQKAAEFRMHDLSDGFAILAPKSLPNVIEDINPDVPELRTNDGSLAFRFTDDGFEMDGDLQINGNLNVDGDVIVTGDVVAGGISLRNHTHGPGSFTNGGGGVTGTSGGPL